MSPEESGATERGISPRGTEGRQRATAGQNKHLPTNDGGGPNERAPIDGGHFMARNVGEAVSPFPEVLPDPGFSTGDSILKSCVEKVAARPSFRSLGIALVDLTGGTRLYAGWQDSGKKGQFRVASVAKIAAMYAAYQLLSAVNKAIVGIAGTDGRELLNQLEEKWKTVIGSKFSDLKPHKPKTDTLRLNNIFTVKRYGTGWKADFASSGEGLQELDDLSEEKGLLRLGFLERMKLMIGWSDDLAATSCVRDLGFQYLNAVLLSSGLFDRQRDGGLWLGRNYDLELWRKDLIGGGTGQGGTALAVAKFMTLLHANLLIDARASQEMKSMMDKLNPNLPGWYSSSFFAEGLNLVPNTHKPSRLAKHAYSKLGYVNKKNFVTYNDCLLVEGLRNSAHSTTYVAVGLGAKSGKTLRKLIVELDSCIVEANTRR